MFEYTSGRDYSFSTTNNLISNLKKKPSRKGFPEYRYKILAMRTCARLLTEAINMDWLNGATLVPVPPSKAANHPEYDNRMTIICNHIRTQFPLDVRELVAQRESLEAAHESAPGERAKVEDLLREYELHEAVATPPPTRIGIVDDVLTAGVHYRAMHTVLSARFPRASIAGFFIARRVFANDPSEEVEWGDIEGVGSP